MKNRCMGTKTIVVDSKVYARLSGMKRKGESFSKTIERLLDEAGNSHTGSAILSRLATVAPLSEADAETFLGVIAGNRENESRGEIDLR